jgi:hypothetical protein
MFVGEARSLPLSGASERFFQVIYSRIGLGLLTNIKKAAMACLSQRNTLAYYKYL